MATVTLLMTEYEDLKRRADKAEANQRQLEEDLALQTIEKINMHARGILTAFRGALDVAKYAMGMLSPEFARKWPKPALLAVIDGIKLLPDATPFELETITVIESFVRDIDHWETARSEGYRAPPAATHEPDPARPVMVSRSTGFLPEDPSRA